MKIDMTRLNQSFIKAAENINDLIWTAKADILLTTAG